LGWLGFASCWFNARLIQCKDFVKWEQVLIFSMGVSGAGTVQALPCSVALAIISLFHLRELMEDGFLGS
jgi:hypothetical protein